MATQLDNYKDIDDLDPTDELPRLDIAAYEAAMADDTAEVISGDLWVVDRDPSADDGTVEFLPAVPATLLREPKVPHPELTADVDIILKRIGDLESQLLQVRLHNADLQSRCESLGQDRDAQAKTVVSLRADNSRLAEHRTLATDMNERLEEKLRSAAAHSAGQIGELEAQRNDLKLELAASAQQMQALQLEYAQLHTDLNAAVALAAERAEAIAALQERLNQAEASIARFAQQLALKLMDYDTMARAMEARNRTIAELRASADSLGSQLTHALTTVNELSSELAATNGELALANEHLHVRAVEVADRDGRIAQLCKDIKSANDELLSVSGQHATALQTLAAHEQTQSELKQELGARMQEIGELRGSLEGVQAAGTTLQDELKSALYKLADEEKAHRTTRADRDERVRQGEQLSTDLRSAQASNLELTRERDLLLPLKEELAVATSALKHTALALQDSQRNLADLHRDFSVQASAAQNLEEELVTAQAAADELRGDRDVLQQAVLRAQQTVETHREQSQTQSKLLQTKHAEWAALKAQLDAQSASFENMDSELRTRDEKIAELQCRLEAGEKEQALTAERIAQSQQHAQSLKTLVAQKTKRIASLKSELTAYAAAVAAIRGNLTQVDPDMQQGAERPRRVFEPVEHDAPAIILSRKVTTIGRTAENDICLRYKLISRNHARLLVAASGVIVEDAGSTNGCFVNGRRIKQQLMRDGDVLSLGGVRYCLQPQPALVQPRTRGNVIDIAEVRTQIE